MSALKKQNVENQNVITNNNSNNNNNNNSIINNLKLPVKRKFSTFNNIQQNENILSEDGLDQLLKANDKLTIQLQNLEKEGIKNIF